MIPIIMSDVVSLSLTMAAREAIQAARSLGLHDGEQCAVCSKSDLPAVAALVCSQDVLCNDRPPFIQGGGLASQEAARTMCSERTKMGSLVAYREAVKSRLDWHLMHKMTA